MSRPSLCYVNNYPLRYVADVVADGGLPTQHLWASDFLAAALGEVVLAPFATARDSSLARLSRGLRYGLGQIDQERYALRSGARVFVSADPVSLRGLALLRRVLPRRVLVTILHHPVTGAVGQRALPGYDLVLCLSRQLRDEVATLPGVDATRIHAVPWGPDVSFRGYEGGVSDDGRIVSTGKSHRDVKILFEALQAVGAPGLIYDLDGRISDTERSTAPGVTVVGPGGPGADPNAPSQYLWSRVISGIRGAGVVAVPTLTGGRLAGLTEINDALILGKPLIVTSSPYLALPIRVGRRGRVPLGVGGSPREPTACGTSGEDVRVESWRGGLRSGVGSLSPLPLLHFAADSSLLGAGAPHDPAARRTAPRRWRHQPDQGVAVRRRPLPRGPRHTLSPLKPEGPRIFPSTSRRSDAVSRSRQAIRMAGKRRSPNLRVHRFSAAPWVVGAGNSSSDRGTTGCSVSR